jgi:large conductance mechanosensitive channel
MFKEFKEFAMKGNVVDLAVGVVIGGAFGKIVTSLVNDIIMPLVGLLIGGVDFTNLFITLDGSNFSTLAEAQEAGAATLNYGLFIGAIIDFLIISFSIFMVIRQINKLKKKEEVVVEEVTTKECNYCHTEIPIKATRCPHCTSNLE